jgi:hypothetical protein
MASNESVLETLGCLPIFCEGRYYVSQQSNLSTIPELGDNILQTYMQKMYVFLFL